MGFAAFLRDILALRPPPAERGPENLAVLERVESTNLLAKAVAADYHRECQDMPEALFLAYEQTGGRGRLGRSWSSPAGRGVYATLARPIDAAYRSHALGTLPLLVGVGLCRGLDRHLAAPCRLKWPNDLLAEGRKIGGILIESMVRPGACVMVMMGFGINYGQSAAELPVEGATSLALAGRAEGAGVGLPLLTWELVAAVERELAHLGDEAYAVAAYRERSVHRPGDRIVARTGEATVEGRFAGFDEHGYLLLARGNGDGGEEVRIASGEVIESAGTADGGGGEP
jgi:BirA family biotin operon repressor/biotin-[acetyl-CoA-carboxylase] ligase